MKLDHIGIPLWMVARRVNNYELDATGATALWPDTTHYKAEVPAGKRWFLLGGIFYRNAAVTATTYVRDSSDNIIGQLGYEGAGATRGSYPEEAQAKGTGWVLDPGEYVDITFSGALDATAYASCCVLEIDIR